MHGDPFVASNVEIYGGTLGLTSHHGIHGNRNKNIKIHDLLIENFETHGIQLNGFDNLEIYDIEIQSSSQIAYLNGEYGHGRFILPRLRKISQYMDDNSKIIKFYGRNEGITIDEIADKLEIELNMAFNYVINGIEGATDENDENWDYWVDCKKNFINDNGIPNGSGMYGIFLSYPGANVFGYGHSGLKSTNAKIESLVCFVLFCFVLFF